MNPLDYIKHLDHHAYFVHSFKDAIIHLKDFLKNKFHIDHARNPDFYYEKFETFGIDEGRTLKERHSSKSFKEGNKRIFIIETSGMTHEAQNSLLKIFEEPHADSHFFLIMPSVEVLLPTLRSRLNIIKQGERQSLIDVENFLKLSRKEKVDFVDDLAKRISDEDATKSDAQEFLVALEIEVYKKHGAEAKGLKEILKARDYLNDRSPSVKQLLEYVVLNL